MSISFRMSLLRLYSKELQDIKTDIEPYFDFKGKKLKNLIQYTLKSQFMIIEQNFSL